MEWRGIVIGGLLPAVLYGVAGVLQKASQRAGAGLGPYLICIGLAVVGVGAAATVVTGERGITSKGAWLAAGMGLAWGVGTWLVALGLTRYAVPVARLAPLYNANTVVVVLLGLLMFAEYREVSLARLTIGVALVVGGTTVVARA
jgi:transporter family protein